MAKGKQLKDPLAEASSSAEPIAIRVPIRLHVVLSLPAGIATGRRARSRRARSRPRSRKPTRGGADLLYPQETGDKTVSTPDQSRTARSLSALPITETDERLIAAAANIGEIRSPKNG